jgi:uncharacterized protein (TIGR00255 family)
LHLFLIQKGIFMLKSMTGFSKSEINEQGIYVNLELKTLNGKSLEINCRLPKSLSHREFEIREVLRNNISRGTVYLNISAETDSSVKALNLNLDVAKTCYEALNNIRKELKLKDTIKLENILVFRDMLYKQEDVIDEELYMKLIMKALRQALKNLDAMRLREGQQISKDIVARMKKIQENIQKIEQISVNKIPTERERLRNRVAQLFESDEIDEHRLQLEIILLADKLDISEECTRLYSHFKFFFDATKSKVSEGRKINFLLQEIHREINTIGSKANDTEISHLVVHSKEELEKIREQVQNIE